MRVFRCEHDQALSALSFAEDQNRTYYSRQMVNVSPFRNPLDIGVRAKLSPRTAYLPCLSKKDGTFLKNGITQDTAKRYSKSFMADKLMDIIASGKRVDMLALEQQMVTKNHGPLNFEPWGVNARGGE